MAANAALLALKAQREAQQRAEEEAFRAAMMAKFAEDDRVEQLNAQKRRLKVKRSAVTLLLTGGIVTAYMAVCTAGIIVHLLLRNNIASEGHASQGAESTACMTDCQCTMHAQQQPLVLPLQIAEHKRAVDKMLEEKRAAYEAARAAEEQEEAARCVPKPSSKPVALTQPQALLWLMFLLGFGRGL